MGRSLFGSIRGGAIPFLVGVLFSNAGVAAEFKEVTFPGVGGLELRGTLTIPSLDAKSGCPAILLLPGSGPTDRDGNAKPYAITDLLKQTAERLSTEGVATLRFDKRAVASYADRWPKDSTAAQDFFAWETFVGDAAAAFRFLASQSGVDPKRVGLLGHSEGSIIALALATGHIEGVSPAGLVLVGTPGRKLTTALEEQLRDHLPQAGIPKEEVDHLVTRNAEIMKVIIDHGTVPDDVPPVLASLYPKGFGKYLQKYLPLDPTRLAAEYNGPVLILQGDKDAQTNVKLDTPPLYEALKAREKGTVELSIVPGVSHNLKRVTGPLDPGLVGPVAPDALDKLVGWVKANLSRQ